MKIKIKKIIASVLTFMMIFMNVPVNVFAEGSVYIGNFPLFDYSEIVSKISNSNWAKIESTDPDNKIIRIKLLSNINGRLYFYGLDRTHIILNANGKTIDGTGRNEAICMENGTNMSIELIGDGTYIEGGNNSLYGGYNICLKSGTINGYTYDPIKVSLEGGYDYYTINSNKTESYKNKKYTESQFVRVSRSETLTVVPHNNFIKLTYNANGGRGTMANPLIDDDGKFTFPECQFTPQTGCHFKGWQVEGNATIYKAGENKQFKLSDNGKSINAIWEKHVFDQQLKTVNGRSTLAKEATCTSNAKYYKSCKCGVVGKGKETFEDLGTKLSHKYTKKVKTADYLRSNATNCQEHATYWYICSVCDANAKDDSNAQDKYYTDENVGNHSYSPKWNYDDDNHWHECTIEGCNEISNKENHTYNQQLKEVNGKSTLATNATCASNAKYYKSCKCGVVGTETFEEPDTKLSHKYTKKVKTAAYLRLKATNCQEHDTYWYICSVCGASAKDDSNARNMYFKDDRVGEHQYSNKLSIDDTEHFYECTVKGCTSKKDAEKHKVSDWIVDEKATLEKEGTKHKECTVCGRILETEKISKKESGTVEKKEAENITINNNVDHLSKNILTEQEIEKVKQGDNAQIYVDVKEEVNKIDLEKVNSSLDSYKLGKVYDISLWLKVGESKRQVTKTKEKLRMSLKVAEDLINKDSKVKRTYKIMRVHEGKVTFLDGTYDEKTQMVTFETDQFSIYALVYNDTKIETPSTKDDNNDKRKDEIVNKDTKEETPTSKEDGNKEEPKKDNQTLTNKEAVTPTVKVEITNKETVKAENKKEVKKVKTGDRTNSVFYLGLFGFSLLIIYCTVMKKFIR